VLAELYSLYVNVYEQRETHFVLLTADFFAALLGDSAAGGVLFLYRRAGNLIGFNLCFVQGDMLVDKYIGFRYPQARDSHLYFISWFQNLEYALAHGLRFYVAGWTDPQVKRALGARFTWTRHAVYARNPLLRALLRRTRHRFESDLAWYQEASDEPTGRT
jgi:predicted N-acyltransferase